LLDRIHRIKFEHLSVTDKLVICNKHLLPEIYKKMGTGNTISISEEIITHLIEEYTCEPGVRKLKELLFEIVGELTLQQLKQEHTNINTISVSLKDVKTLLAGKKPMRKKKVHATPSIGLITGLWANSVGQGGTLPIESQLYPTDIFLDLKLTGSQGDVMRESMTVAKTLAWDLLTDEQALYFKHKVCNSKNQGLHIHVPEGATPKDGPSAGTAITIAMYSLLTEKPIRSDIAITGEICLKGNVTAIGGLDLKILGGISAGVSHFIYPDDNHDDFLDFHEKHKGSALIENITFTKVKHIRDVMPIVFDTENC